MHTHGGQTLHVLRGQVCLTILLTLRQRHIQRFVVQQFVVHFSDTFGGVFGLGETHEAETFRSTVLVFHHLQAQIQR